MQGHLEEVHNSVPALTPGPSVDAGIAQQLSELQAAVKLMQGANDIGGTDGDQLSFFSPLV